MHKQFELVDEIRPRLDVPDHYGSLPLFYSLQQDDVKMISKFFADRPQDCFRLRNYKWETIFHIAAKSNSVQSLKLIIGNSVFIDQLLKKDYMGNTAIHIAAKNGSLETLRFLCQNVTKSFLQIENDFGFNPHEASKEKLRLMENALASKEEVGNVEVFKQKMANVEKASKFLFQYDDFVTEERWNAYFEMPF